jgi:ribonuclease HII
MLVAINFLPSPMARFLELSKLKCTRKFEAEARRQGWELVAGCDEVGRGALLGPLYAAAVILDPARPIRGVDDSKKLTPLEREALAEEIRKKALSFHIIAISAEEVDLLNVYEASRVAMIRALRALDPSPHFVLTDAMPLSHGADSEAFNIPFRAIIHGDARSISIAAASILAKVERDKHLETLDQTYPQYGLAHNKGYGTREHLEALARFGPCAEHRKTYQPVKDYLLPLFPFSKLV